MLVLPLVLVYEYGNLVPLALSLGSLPWRLVTTTRSQGRGPENMVGKYGCWSHERALSILIYYMVTAVIKGALQPEFEKHEF